jgi:hypothetical protein
VIVLANQEMALMGLEIVMPMAQPSEIVELGGAALVHGYHVVDLQAVPDVTARNHALGIALDDRSADGRRNGPTGVAHGCHIDTVGHQHVEDRVLGQSPGGRHRNWSDPRDLADLARFDMASE